MSTIPLRMENVKHNIPATSTQNQKQLDDYTTTHTGCLSPTQLQF